MTQIGIIQEALRSGKITVPAKLPDGIFAGKLIRSIQCLNDSLGSINLTGDKPNRIRLNARRF